MKAIALVTMFFLPGTFVSSLLSVPIFDWDAAAAEDAEGEGGGIWKAMRPEVWRPRVVVFLGITVPLMAVTFAVWAGWVGWRYLQARRREERVARLLDAGDVDGVKGQGEAELIARKRKGLSEGG
jgi:hypothetical protein